MYKIVEVNHLSEKNWLMKVEAPFVTRNCQPGQFLIVRVCENGERIPLTICDYDREKGLITIVFQVVGGTTYRLSQLKVGDSISDMVGPLGHPSEFIHIPLDELKKKKYLFVGGGVGTAPIYAQVKWFHDNGLDCDVIIGARTKELIFMEKEMAAVAGRLFITTDDGSYGEKGVVTNKIKELVAEGNKYDVCIAIGPIIMMKFCSITTKELNIPTIVSMNPIMIDGTGMCGACRLKVGDEVKFACVDGPEFDGHLVDYDLAMKRQKQYRTEEGRKMLEIQEGATHSGGCGLC